MSQHVISVQVYICPSGRGNVQIEPGHCQVLLADMGCDWEL